MEAQEIKLLVKKQKVFFETGLSKNVNFRKEKLICLYSVIVRNEELILDALKADLNKSKYEAYMTEVGIVLSEIKFMLKKITKWSKPKRVRTSITQAPGKSVIYHEPFGTTLIISPWNYPFQLAINPLIGAIAAGNTAILKPSNYSINTSKIIKQIIEEVFPEEYVSVVEGGRDENTSLLDQRFDFIFFTGSVAVGKVVMEAAAKYLTPVCLELGGKSPCIVEKTADLRLAAKRIIWGKLINSGQTCIAPDYVLVDKVIKNQLLILMKEAIINFYEEKSLDCDYYPKIISNKHYDRLLKLVLNEEVYYGNETNGTQISPTILNNVSWNSPIMQEEIFGPILPILDFEDLSDAILKIKEREKPLALYLFSKNKEIQNKIVREISYGGGCINDTILHLSSETLPFGGVGNSGLGNYHGYYSFKTFSHEKGILKKGSLFDIALRYPPYNKKMTLIKKILK